MKEVASTKNQYLEDIRARRFFSYVFSGFLVFVLLVIVFSVSSINDGFDPTKSAEDTAYHFIKLLEAGDYESAYSLTSEDFKSASTIEGLEGMSEEHDVLTDNTAISIDRIIPGEQVTVVSGQVSSGSSIGAITMDMVQSDSGIWLVSYFSLDPRDVPADPPKVSE